MGFRISYNCNTVPAYIKDNKLYCDLLLPGTYIELNVDNIDFPEQCIHFKNDNVMCYLKSGEFEVALRFNGTGCLVQKGMLRRSFLFEMPKDYYAIEEKGSVNVDGIDYVVKHVHLNNDTTITFTQALPITLVVKDYSKSIFTRDLRTAKPNLKYNNTKKCFNDDDGNRIGVVQYNSRGFKVLGGNCYGTS